MSTINKSKKALQKAIDLAGGQVALAEGIAKVSGIPVSNKRIWNWLHRDQSPVPAEMAAPIEKFLDGAVTRHQLRPDLFDASQ